MQNLSFHDDFTAIEKLTYDSMKMGNFEGDIWGGKRKPETILSSRGREAGKGGAGGTVAAAGIGGHIGHHEKIWVTPVQKQHRLGKNTLPPGWTRIPLFNCLGEEGESMEEDGRGLWICRGSHPTCGESGHGTPLPDSILDTIGDAVTRDAYSDVQELMSNNPHLKDTIVKTSIWKALRHNSTKTLAQLVEIYETDDLGGHKMAFRDVFRLCTDWNDVRALIRFALRHQGALQWLRDPCGRNAVHVALKHGDVDLCQDIADKEPGILGLPSQSGHTALHAAILSMRQQCVDMFLRAGVNPDEKTRDGLPPLMLAVINDNFEAFKSLINAGADVNCKDSCGMSPIHHAVANGRLEYAKILIQSGALESHELMQSVKISVLNMAVTKGHVNIVKLLLGNGCSPAGIDYAEGWAAIHFASAECPDPGCLSCILDHPDADVNLRTRDGRTALMLAVSYGQCELVRRLVNHPQCIINMVDNKSGMTALHRATDSGCYQCTNILLQKGSTPDTRDQDGATPLLLAVNSRHTHLIVDLLLWGRGWCPWQPLLKPDHAVLELALKRDYWDIIHALILFGWNKATVHKQCRQKPDKVQDMPKVVKETLTSPHSLKHVCRLQLKIFAGAKLPEYVRKIGLPSSVTDFLLFTDLRERSFWCS